MTRGEQVGRLQLHFNRETLTPERFRAIVAELADVPVALLEEAVTKLIRTQAEPWFPTVGLIRETCAEISLALPAEHAALAQVDALLAWARDDALGRPERPPAVQRTVKLALDQVGGTAAFRASEQPSVIRGQFSRIYRELRAAEIRNAQLAPALESGPRPPSPPSGILLCDGS